MDSSSLAILADAYANIDIFLIIAVRVLGFIILVPTLTGSNIPSTAKIGFSVLIAFLLFTSGKISVVAYSPTVIGYMFLVLKEFIVGFMMAFSAYLIFSITYYVGQLIDMQIGFSMVSVLDPLTQIQVPIMGNLLYFIICIFFVRSGGLHSFIQAVFYSYDVLPIGKAVIVGNYAIYSQFVKLMMDYIVIGVRFSLPVVGSILVLDIALGLLVKASPQMNVFVVGIPIKLIIGLFLVYMITPVFPELYDLLYSESFDSTMTILKGMIP